MRFAVLLNVAYLTPLSKSIPNARCVQESDLITCLSSLSLRRLLSSVVLETSFCVQGVSYPLVSQQANHSLQDRVKQRKEKIGTKI
jgi:hypothetical protein